MEATLRDRSRRNGRGPVFFVCSIFHGPERTTRAAARQQAAPDRLGQFPGHLSRRAASPSGSPLTPPSRHGPGRAALRVAPSDLSDRDREKERVRERQRGRAWASAHYFSTHGERAGHCSRSFHSNQSRMRGNAICHARHRCYYRCTL